MRGFSNPLKAIFSTRPSSRLLKLFHPGIGVKLIHVVTIWVLNQKLVVFPPNHPILIGFSIINHPFWVKTPYFWKHLYSHLSPIFILKNPMKIIYVSHAFWCLTSCRSDIRFGKIPSLSPASRKVQQLVTSLNTNLFSA